VVTATDGVYTVSSDPHDKTWIDCEGPVLTISKSGSPDPVPPGGALIYNIIIGNIGSANATGVTIVDDYDETILTITDPDGGHISDPPDTITWNGGITIPVGGSVFHTVTASINPTAAAGTTFYNTANVTCAEGVSSHVTIGTTVRTPRPRPTYGGGGGGTPRKYLTVDFEGKITKKLLDSNDRLTQTLMGPSPDGRNSLEIEKGTQAPIADGERIYLITIREVEEPLPLPECTVVAEPVYNITPSGTVFDEDVILTLGFNPLELPENTVSATMAYYEAAEGWIPLESRQEGVAELGTMSAAVRHFTPFAILVELDCAPPPPAPLPAHFVTSGLNIVPSIREIWEPVTFVTKTGETATITATVANDGEQEGSYIVRLKIDGETVDTKEVVLGMGQSQPVSFTLSGMDYGQHKVELAELSGEFPVSRTINWWLIIGIIVAIGLITWGVIWGRRRRRAAQAG
jgi:hypothetical protein